MTSETDQTSMADALFGSWVSAQILDENRPYNVCRPHFRYAGPEKSNAYDFPIQSDPGAAGASYTESTGLSNTELGASDETATATAKGMMTTVTDELDEVSLFDSFSQYGGVLARSVLERAETDFTALLDDFANTTGTAGVDTTWATLLEAVNQLEQRDQTGNAVIILDPAQVGDVRVDIGTSGAGLMGNPGFPAAGMQDATLGGDSGLRVGQTPVLQTSLVSATGGAVFISGVALGLYEIRPLRTELERDASLPGTEIVVTNRFGVVEIRDVAGETILI
jgi:hypothetical protein